MLDKETHRKLVKTWEDFGSVYQTEKRIQRRMPSFCQRIDVFRGLDVVEFGCNAGLHGLEIQAVANSYVGVDSGKGYIAQAWETQKYMDNPNVEFVCGTVKQFLKQNTRTFTGLFCSYALYHFSRKETDQIAAQILPTCKVAFIRTRTKKRTPWRMYNPHKFWKPKNVARYLKAAGLTKIEIHMEEGGKFADIIGVRDGD